MNTLRFTIPGSLPSLNVYTLANRGNRFGGNRAKKAAQACITPYLPRPIDTLRYPVGVTIVWHERDNRRDPDNVMFGAKFILDALVNAGVLDGDSRRHIAAIAHRVTTDRVRPRVEVTIEDAS